MPLVNDPELSVIAVPPYLELMVKHLKPLQLNTFDKDNIFVFFHLRKCGGTTLRNAIHAALNESMDIAGQQWIPCLDSPCVPYSIPPTGKSVYASHLSFTNMLATTREAETQRKNMDKLLLSDGRNYTYNSLQDGFKGCLTNLRGTVSRVISCWNYRMMKFGMPPASELTARDWDTLLPKVYDEFNNGCNNEIFRAFGSPSQDETLVNTINYAHPSFSFELNRAAHRLSTCVVVIPDRCNESNAVLSHFIPWLENFDLCREKLNMNPLQSKNTTLSEEATKAILRHNQLDDILFHFGEKLFEDQVRIAMQGGY